MGEDKGPYWTSPHPAVLRIGFLASHGGSNLQAIIDACTSGELKAQPVVVISNNSGSTALERARAKTIPAVHLSSQTHPDAISLDQAILDTLKTYNPDVIALAGYMKRLGPKTLGAYEGRILNVHPGPLPTFGGETMFGQRVHEAVLASGAMVSAATVHLVDEFYDHGPVIGFTPVPILPDDRAESLAARVLVAEHRLYIDTLRRIAEGELSLPMTSADAVDGDAVDGDAVESCKWA